MQTQHPHPAEIALEQLAQAFEQWRATKSTRASPIPEALLDQALVLTQQLPTSRVLRRLRLSSSQLQQRRKQVATTQSTPDFVSLGSVAASTAKPKDVDPPHGPEVTPLTLRLNHGQTLTLSGLPPSELVALLVALLER